MSLATSSPSLLTARGTGIGLLPRSFSADGDPCSASCKQVVSVKFCTALLTDSQGLHGTQRALWLGRDHAGALSRRRNKGNHSLRSLTREGSQSTGFQSWERTGRLRLSAEAAAIGERRAQTQVPASTSKGSSTGAANVGSTRGLIQAKPGSGQVSGKGSGLVAAGGKAGGKAKLSAAQVEAERRAAARAVGAVSYDPEVLTEKYTREPWQVWARTARILSNLGAFGAGLLWDRQTGRLQANMGARAAELRSRLTVLGPTFVKLGQALSTRPDLCPREYLEELAELQDALPTFPDTEAFACIEKELGQPLESMFARITASPIAAASLGQVYKAELRTGEVVAVKVQRPGIEATIGLDFYLLRQVTALVDEYVSTLTTKVVPLLDSFAERVYQELNYVQEGRNALRFKSLYGDRPDVFVPEPFWDQTSGKVLTMEWVDGVKLSEQKEIEARGLSVVALVESGIQCSLRQLLEHGYFHADPHPGNLLATRDGRLAFLDFGMMSETPEIARYAIIGHVVHLVNRDYEAMARDYYTLDFLAPEVDVSPIVPALRGFFDDVLNASVSELNFKTIVDGLGAVLYQYPFNVPPYYALILRSLTVLEGLALYTDPNFKVLAAAYPYMAKRLLTDPSPYLRDALIELLFKDGRFRWDRLENLLVQGRTDSDYRGTEVLQPVLGLLLGPEGEPLRRLVEKEAVRVMEAFVLAGVVDVSQQVNAQVEPMLGRLGGGGGGGGAGAGGASALLPGPMGQLLAPKMREDELVAMQELRGQVLRVWGLLQQSRDFDPAMLQPVVEVLQEPEAQAMGGRVAGGVLRRLAARFLQQILRPQAQSAAAAGQGR